MQMQWDIDVFYLVVEIKTEYHKNSITSQIGQLLCRLCIKELWKRKKFHERNILKEN